MVYSALTAFLPAPTKSPEALAREFGEKYAVMSQFDIEADLLPRFIRMAEDEKEKLDRIAELEERLEIAFEWVSTGDDPNNLVKREIPPEERTFSADGIACRDATIKLQDERIKRQSERIAELEGLVAGGTRVNAAWSRSTKELMNRIAELEAALAPFAKIPQSFVYDGQEAVHYWTVIGAPHRQHFTRSDLARARNALQSGKEAHGEAEKEKSGVAECCQCSKLLADGEADICHECEKWAHENAP